MMSDLPERTQRALLEKFRVYKFSDELYLVESPSGNYYNVDLDEKSCECPDHQYRGTVCKHQRAAVLHDARDEVILV